MPVVLDASALLAYLQDENGTEVIDELLSVSIMNCVNWSEVVQKMLSKQMDINGIREELELLGLTIVPFTLEQAELAARLWKETKNYGLSLADRACLSTAMVQNIPVYTADKMWKSLDLSVQIICIR